MQNLVLDCGADDFLDHKKKIIQGVFGLGWKMSLSRIMLSLILSFNGEVLDS